MKTTANLNRPFIARAVERDGSRFLFADITDDRPDVDGVVTPVDELNRMAEQLRQGSGSLTDRHYSPFTIARAIGGSVRQDADRAVLEAEYEIKPEYPQAVELWREVSEGGCAKELSIEATFEPGRSGFEDGAIVVRGLELQYTAVCLPGRGKSSGTGFRAAIARAQEEKTLDIKELARERDALKVEKDDLARELAEAKAKNLEADAKVEELSRQVEELKTAASERDEQELQGLLSRCREHNASTNADPAVEKQIGWIEKSWNLGEREMARSMADQILATKPTAHGTPVTRSQTSGGTDKAELARCYAETLAAGGINARVIEGSKVEIRKRDGSVEVKEF